MLRKLRIMSNAGNGSGSGSSARSRTLARMGALLGGAIGAAQVSCSDGYGVVDPIPPPARCERQAAGLTGKARFERREDGILELVIELFDAAGGPLDFRTISDVELAVPSKTVVDKHMITVRLAPNPELGSIRGALNVECLEGTSKFQILVEWKFEDVNTGRDIIPRIWATY